MQDVEDQAFWDLHSLCSEFSLLTPEKLYSLYGAAHYICDRRIMGDVIECGVWKGGAVLMLAEVFFGRGMLDYDIYLYDTFAGFVERSESDVTASGKELGKVRHKDFMHETRANVARSSYPTEKINFIQGDVRETVRSENHPQIALLRLDTDTYASTLHELTALYDRVVTGGVIIIDDYGYSRGCRQAVDEFFSNRPKVFLQRTNTGARTAVKV